MDTRMGSRPKSVCAGVLVATVLVRDEEEVERCAAASASAAREFWFEKADWCQWCGCGASRVCEEGVKSVFLNLF